MIEITIKAHLTCISYCSSTETVISFTALVVLHTLSVVVCMLHHALEDTVSYPAVNVHHQPKAPKRRQLGQDSLRAMRVSANNINTQRIIWPQIIFTQCLLIFKTNHLTRAGLELRKNTFFAQIISGSS